GHTMNFLINCVSIISQGFCHHVSNSVVPNVSQWRIINLIHREFSQFDVSVSVNDCRISFVSQ
ncbi:hypothetical protein L9F63_026576, partial [Diploptera punctata]